MKTDFAYSNLGFEIRQHVQIKISMHVYKQSAEVKTHRFS